MIMARRIMLFILGSCLVIPLFAQKSQQDYYIVKVYHCSSMEQIEAAESFAGNTLKPFLHAQGIKHVGIFMPLNNDTLTDKKLMVWIPLKGLNQYATIDEKLNALDPWGNDPVLQHTGKQGQMPYLRIESSLASAFRDMRHYDPATTFKRDPANVYEFRSYESPTEAMHLNKVHMFNEGGEIPLFSRLGFNALFYAHVMVGPRMPNLIYMTRFENMQSRTDHWKAFVEDPVWKKLTADPKYQGSVSRNETILMKASSFSDL